jgi:hypothetical protein
LLLPFLPLSICPYLLRSFSLLVNNIYIKEWKVYTAYTQNIFNKIMYNFCGILIYVFIFPHQRISDKKISCWLIILFSLLISHC